MPRLAPLVHPHPQVPLLDNPSLTISATAAAVEDLPAVVLVLPRHVLFSHSFFRRPFSPCPRKSEKVGFLVSDPPFSPPRFRLEAPPDEFILKSSSLLTAELLIPLLTFPFWTCGCFSKSPSFLPPGGSLFLQTFSVPPFRIQLGELFLRTRPSDAPCCPLFIWQPWLLHLSFLYRACAP